MPKPGFTVILLLSACCTGRMLLDVSPEHPEKRAVVKQAPVIGEVSVNGPSTVFVIQGGQFRAIITRTREGAGRVEIPLRALDDGSGRDLFVGALPGTILDHFWRPDPPDTCVPCGPDLLPPLPCCACCPMPPSPAGPKAVK